MRVNVEAMFLNAKHAIPAMIESGDGGAIVNISSIAALRPRGMSAYSTSKAAVIGLTRAMAIDHAGDGIRVNCIAPGVVYTPMVYAGGMSDDGARTAPEVFASWQSRVPAGTSAARWSFWRRNGRATSPARPSWSTGAARSAAHRSYSGTEAAQVSTLSQP